MSNSDSLRAAIADRLAAQWIALGGQLTGEPDRTVIDLEALVVATAEIPVLDARVSDVAFDWCLAHGRMVNGSRLRTVAAEVTADASRLGVFAGSVAASGGPRWPVATSGPRHVPRGKVVASDLAAPSRLTWRLRAAFGVNARADLLVVLAAAPNHRLAVADLAQRTRFTKRNVAAAVASMALAGVVEVDRVGIQDRVRLAPDFPLRPWLDVPASASVDWTSRWTVALRMLLVAEATDTASPMVRAVELRAELAGLKTALFGAHLPKPDLTAVGSEAVTVASDAWLASLALALRDLAR